MNKTLIKRRNNSKNESEFIKATNSHVAPPETHPWEGLDPEASYEKGLKGSMVNVKFNPWELSVLKHLAKKDNRSLNMYLKLIFRDHAIKEVDNIN